MLRCIGIILFVLLLLSCENSSEEKFDLELSEDFKEYWYSGQAEITSYNLEQARYGELHKGEAILIYVTEDFLPVEQVKASKSSENNISILKLNATKTFNTGIYPYSIMESCFYPLNGEEHALKVAASIQEWCGQVYMQLNKRENFDIITHSYFDGEADSKMRLDKVELENEVWNRLRVTNEELPTGQFKMLPSLEYLRLSHQPVKAYKVLGEYYTMDDLNVYQLTYPELNRKLKIYYSKTFPYTIEKWEESFPSAIGAETEILTTKAVKKQRIKTDYWNKNSNKNLPLRDKLELN